MIQKGVFCSFSAELGVMSLAFEMIALIWGRDVFIELALSLPLLFKKIGRQLNKKSVDYVII